MTTYASVVPGIDMSQALGAKRLTKTWLRDYLRISPEKDFRMLQTGQYVNGQDCVRYDVVLEVRRPDSLDLVAVVVFKEQDETGPAARPGSKRLVAVVR